VGPELAAIHCVSSVRMSSGRGRASAYVRDTQRGTVIDLSDNLRWNRITERMYWMLFMQRDNGLRDKDLKENVD